MNESRNGVQTLIKPEYPHAHFLLCYAHQLNLVVKRMCSDISLARIFFANVSGFSAYSSKRIDFLKAVRFRIVLKHDGISSRLTFEVLGK